MFACHTNSNAIRVFVQAANVKAITVPCTTASRHQSFNLISSSAARLYILLLLSPTITAQRQLTVTNHPNTVTNSHVLFRRTQNYHGSVHKEKEVARTQIVHKKQQ